MNKEEYKGKGDEEKGENEEEYEGEGDEGEDEVDGRAYEEGSLGSFGDGHTRPFILSTIWTVNDFKPIMMTNIFKTLRDHYQSLITFQSVYSESLKSDTLGRSRMSACMTSCSQ